MRNKLEAAGTLLILRLLAAPDAKADQLYIYKAPGTNTETGNMTYCN